MPARGKLNYRSFISLLTTFSFITAAVSGLVLHVSPQGRVAFWQNWTMLGLGKGEWNNLAVSRLTAAVRPRVAHAASVAPVAPASVPAVTPEIERYTEDSVVIKFEGTGVGKKTLEQVCREFDIPLSTAQRKLAAKGLTVSPTETFKDAAKRAGLVPIEILQVVLVGEPARK